MLSGGYLEFLLIFLGLFQFLQQSESQEIENHETSFAPKVPFSCIFGPSFPQVLSCTVLQCGGMREFNLLLSLF